MAREIQTWRKSSFRNPYPEGSPEWKSFRSQRQTAATEYTGDISTNSEASHIISVITQGERGHGVFGRLWARTEKSPQSVRVDRDQIPTVIYKPKSELPSRTRSKYISYKDISQFGAKLQENYLFDEFKFIAMKSAEDGLVKYGKRIVQYIRTNMTEGNFRPYLSKRAKAYAGRIIAKQFADIIGKPSVVRSKRSPQNIRAWKGISDIPKTYYTKHQQGRPGSHGHFEGFKWISHTGETKQQLKSKWLSLKREEAYRENPAGSMFTTSSIWEKSGGKKRRIGYRFGRLSEGGRGLIHWSSSPGQPPAPDTEQLRDSISAEVIHYKKDVFRLRVVADTPYAKTMELGSAKQSIAPRPFIRPAIMKYSALLMNEYQKAFRKMCSDSLSIKTQLGSAGKAKQGVGADWNILASRRQTLQYMMSEGLYARDKWASDIIKAYSKTYGDVR